MEAQEQLDRLTGIVEALAPSAVAHDDQIGNLIKVAEKHQQELDEFRRSMAQLRQSHSETMRLFEAYLRRLPPQ